MKLLENGRQHSDVRQRTGFEILVENLVVVAEAVAGELENDIVIPHLFYTSVDRE